MKHKKIKLSILLLLCLDLAGIQAQTVKDIDDNVYKTVKIGNQVWMAENLKVTKFNNGTAIPLVTDEKAWRDRTSPGYCWFDNNQGTYSNPYGALYNGYVVKSGNVCPVGWHVPTEKDWDNLQKRYGTDAGIQLKEKGNQHWKNNSAEVTNETGFSAVGGGYRHALGSFEYLKGSGFWWTSVEANLKSMVIRAMWGKNTTITKGSMLKKTGASIRCIKN